MPMDKKRKKEKENPFFTQISYSIMNPKKIIIQILTISYRNFCLQQQNIFGGIYSGTSVGDLVYYRNTATFYHFFLYLVLFQPEHSISLFSNY